MRLVVLRPDVAHRPEAQPGDPQHGVDEHLPLGPRAEQGHVDLGDVRGRGVVFGARRLLLHLLVGTLLPPGMAEQPQRRDGRQAQEHVATAESLSGDLAGAAVLLVFAGHLALLLRRGAETCQGNHHLLIHPSNERVI
jgi:hypothetical protein